VYHFVLGRTSRAPHLDRGALEEIRRRGERAMDRFVEYISAFAKEFEQIDVSKALARS